MLEGPSGLLDEHPTAPLPMGLACRVEGALLLKSVLECGSEFQCGAVPVIEGTLDGPGHVNRSRSEPPS